MTTWAARIQVKLGGLSATTIHGLGLVAVSLVTLGLDHTSLAGIALQVGGAVGGLVWIVMPERARVVAGPIGTLVQDGAVLIAHGADPVAGELKVIADLAGIETASETTKSQNSAV